MGSPRDNDYDHFINIDNENYIKTYDKRNQPIYNKENEMIREPIQRTIVEQKTKLNNTYIMNDDECPFPYDYDDIDDAVYHHSFPITAIVSFITTCISRIMDTN